MSRTITATVTAAILALGGSLIAQAGIPEIAFTTSDFLKTPSDVYVGEVGGVAANSKGLVYVYHRSGHPYATLGDNRTFYRGGSRLFQFDAGGKYLREFGQDVYGFNAAIGLRIDPQDNVWTIDEGANQVVKFDTEGRVALVLGRKPETISVRPNAAPAGAAGGAAAKPAKPAGRRAPVLLARASAVPPTSRGIAPATSMSPMALAATTALPSWTRTAASSRTGVRPARGRDSLPGSRRWPSTRKATSTRPTSATSASRCSTPRARSSPSSAASAPRSPCA